jgi:hypothetical protein
MEELTSNEKAEIRAALRERAEKLMREANGRTWCGPQHKDFRASLRDYARSLECLAGKVL